MHFHNMLAIFILLLGIFDFSTKKILFATFAPHRISHLIFRFAFPLKFGIDIIAKVSFETVTKERKNAQISHLSL